MRRRGWARLAAVSSAVVGLLLASGMAGAAPAKKTMPALMVSDIHFEPFWDPGKVTQLAAAPASGWKAILAGAPTADREAEFKTLEDKCKVRGEDTSYPLFASSLTAMGRDAAGAKFATVSGDLIAHAFSCKFGTMFPKAAAGAYRAFVEKTIEFVVEELRGALPGVPVYVALGNNDSDCGDYKLDGHSEFLAATGEVVTREFAAAERKSALESFAAGGYYSAGLPVKNARLLVLNDLFMAARYQTCGGKSDAAGADEQLAWLEAQLTEARNRHEKVWVMAHIPPGVDGHASAAKAGDICGAKGPKMFLGSEKLAEELAAFGDVVELAVFAHTHMDEVRVLKPEGGGAGTGVAVKLVPSISPIDGNVPSFTIAQVDTATAELRDFRVLTASNATGAGTEWKEEYDWGKSYGESAFSAAGVGHLIAGLEADKDGTTAASGAYMHHFFSGKDSPLLALVWPLYTCALEHDSAEAYKGCACAAH